VAEKVADIERAVKILTDKESKNPFWEVLNSTSIFTDMGACIPSCIQMRPARKGRSHFYAMSTTPPQSNKIIDKFVN